jgi:hypothetical protein
MLPSDHLSGLLTLTVGDKTQQFTPRTLDELEIQIDAAFPEVNARFEPGNNGQRLVLQTNALNASDDLVVTTNTLIDLAKHTTVDLLPAEPDFLISLPDAEKQTLNSHHTRVTIHLDDATLVHLTDTDWQMVRGQSPIVVLTVDKDEPPCTPAGSGFTSDEFNESCHAQYLLVRNEAEQKVILGMEVKTRITTFDLSLLGFHLNLSVPSSTTSIKRSVLIVKKELLDDTDSIYVVNGKTTLVNGLVPYEIPPSQDAWRIDWFRRQNGCRYYSVRDDDRASVTIRPPPETAKKLVTNGIDVGAAKIFDVATLRAMLNSTANQLAAISGFTAASITSAYGNLQGLTRDSSFLTAQVTTVATPGIVAANSTGLSGTNSTSITAPTPASSSTTVTLQCPDGSLPTIGASNAQGCTVPSSPPSGGIGSTSTETTNGTTNPSGATQQSSGSTSSQQNGSTVTTPSISGAVPTAPASTALTPPNNIGVASADILTEQVQLNAQITTLRLLLQGALSDQYLLKNSRAVATRQQTTLGFSITLDPPRQFKHAVAEVRVIITPPPGQDAVSIMNLLPSEKTYNVAKVTSHQNAFGAGVAMAPVAVGVSTGKSKDRLYLAKDTDTLALQFPLPRSRQIKEPLPQAAHDWLKAKWEFEPLGACDDAENDLNPDSVAYGWQFRPVLGADYVKGGQRQVFAQLALPAGLGENYVPIVYIQTRWRAYDPKRQVVGAVYTDTCSSFEDTSGVAVVNAPRVENVGVYDLGSGQLKLTAKGQFYSSGVSVLAGSNILYPIGFDGKTIEIVGNAHDLMEAGELTIVGQGGQNSPFAIISDKEKRDAGQCSIVQAKLRAMPRPDGNSRVELHLQLGAGYDPDYLIDGELNPLVLIGSQVYGLRETPFLNSREQACERILDPDISGFSCTYYFIAPTTDLRNAQTYLVRDIAWENIQEVGRIEFLPSFASLAISSTYTPEKKGDENVTPDSTTLFTIGGYDLLKISPTCSFPLQLEHPCLRVFVGDEEKTWSEVHFGVETDNRATMLLSKAALGNAKEIRLLLLNSPITNESAVEWDEPTPKSDEPKASSSPLYLRVGDSGKVTFTGVDYSKVDAVTFESQPPLVIKYNPDSKSLDVFITTSITKLAGRKELTATVKGSTKPLQLSIDVLRQ